MAYLKKALFFKRRARNPAILKKSHFSCFTTNCSFSTENVLKFAGQITTSKLLCGVYRFSRLISSSEILLK